jgi:hypothetical protein
MPNKKNKKKQKKTKKKLDRQASSGLEPLHKFEEFPHPVVQHILLLPSL